MSSSIADVTKVITDVINSRLSIIISNKYNNDNNIKVINDRQRQQKVSNVRGGRSSTEAEKKSCYGPRGVCVCTKQFFSLRKKGSLSPWMNVLSVQITSL